MLMLLLSAAAVSPYGLADGQFDLADVAALVASQEERDPAARYLLPDVEEPDEDEGGIRVKLRWRKVRVTVPIDGLQPPF